MTSALPGQGPVRAADQPLEHQPDQVLLGQHALGKSRLVAAGDQEIDKVRRAQQQLARALMTIQRP
jgi:hypothetical protein